MDGRERLIVRILLNGRMYGRYYSLDELLVNVIVEAKVSRMLLKKTCNIE
jgi:hypothetical protein